MTVQSSLKQPILLKQLLKRLNFQSEHTGNILFAAALALYALVVSTGLDHYPIYFFSDEAIHMNMAADFLQDHYQNYDHEFLPTFFRQEGWVNGTSVYLQVLPYLLFGKSIIVTRLVSAAVTWTGALALGLLLKQVFKIKYYWAGVLLLLTTPAWFLHARTAFEYAEVAAFYCIFLYFYSRYRAGHLPSLFGAILAGALTFYTHGLGQILMGVTGLALFIIDLRYHLAPQHRKILIFATLLGFLVLLPFARYEVAHPAESLTQMERRGSYWINDNLTFPQKIGEFVHQYLYGLNPLHWYLPNSVDIERHIMKGYGNGLAFTFPFALIGFLLALKTIRQPPHYIALAAFLAAPVPASLVAIGMPRMLWMAIPLAIFTTLGLSFCLEWLEQRWNNLSLWLAPSLFILLTSLGVFMLGDALINGPTWFQDYDLYGMQYGAQQIFQQTVVPDLEADPALIYIISPSWANGAEKFADFFVPDELRTRVGFGQPVNLLMITGNNSGSPNVVITFNNQEQVIPLPLPHFEFTSETRFIVTVNEYDSLLKDPKFRDIVIHKIIPYPNGQPGFYVLSLRAVDNVTEILAAEEHSARTPVQDFIQLDDQQIHILHSPFGSGDLSMVFDNDPQSLASVLEANPLTFELFPAIPMNTHTMTLQTGSLPDFTVSVSLYAPGITDPIEYTKTFIGLPPDPTVQMDFDQGPARSARIYIEIKDNLTGETSQIHVRTIEFR